MDPLLAWDVAHACWEVATLTGVEAVNVWAAWFRIAVTSYGGCHGLLSNVSYMLVDFTLILSFFIVFLAHGLYSLIAVNRGPGKVVYIYDHRSLSNFLSNGRKVQYGTVTGTKLSDQPSSNRRVQFPGTAERFLLTGPDFESC